MIFSSVLIALAAYAGLARGQYPPKPTGLTVVQSKLQPEVEISYKENHLCETTPGVKSFSGYVTLPERVLKDIGLNYTINTFFWYFESRKNPHTAPLAIYLAGGPGESSVYSALSSESGPCYVNPDGNSTTLNPWSFNNHANVLYIDQPVSAGFSYTSLIKGAFNLFTNDVTPLSAYDGNVPETNATFGLGMYSSQEPWATTNTTITSSRVLWKFAENWISTFLAFKSKNKNIGIWGNSAGGFWVPATAAIFDRQLKATAKNSPLHGYQVDTIGITNGCIDELIQAPFYPEYAYNNTYNEQFIPKAVYEDSLQNFTKPGGCRDLILECRALGDEGDPKWTGSNETVNTACQDATVYCELNVVSALNALTNRTAFDVAVEAIDGNDPCPYYHPIMIFLNQEWTQDEMGVPLNFTYDSNLVTAQYTLYLPTFPNRGTGDEFRKDIKDFEYILQNDIKVALIYGDRDYRCPWNGVESLAINANYPGHAQFSRAGYENITTNASYVGGVVKQHDKFSFSRIFQAGHAVSSYQPETVYRIFMRTTFNQDVATGRKIISEKHSAGNKRISGKKYSSSGPFSSWDIKEKLPEVPPTCMVAGQFQNVSVWKSFF